MTTRPFREGDAVQKDGQLGTIAVVSPAHGDFGIIWDGAGISYWHKAEDLKLIKEATNMSVAMTRMYMQYLENSK